MFDLMAFVSVFKDALGAAKNWTEIVGINEADLEPSRAEGQGSHGGVAPRGEDASAPTRRVAAGRRARQDLAAHGLQSAQQAAATTC